MPVIKREIKKAWTKPACKTLQKLISEELKPTLLTNGNITTQISTTLSLSKEKSSIAKTTNLTLEPGVLKITDTNLNSETN
jgi:hypothetical protein